MKRKNKISKILLFRDKNDYIKKISNDNIINVTGEKGSGKSYFGSVKDNDETCIVIHLDQVFSPDTSNNYNYSKEIREILINKFGKTLNPDDNFENKYYPVIVEYLNKKGKTGYIEGGSISEIQNISNIVGTVIVKRTGVIKCFIRAVKRDYNNEYFMKEEIKRHGKFAKITRLYKVIKRRKKIFKTYHHIEHFIEKLELL
jgi:hypothetical protein